MRQIGLWALRALDGLAWICGEAAQFAGWCYYRARRALVSWLAK